MEDHFESRCENCIIRELNALKALSKKELKNLSDHKTSKKVKKGEVIFKEGEPINGIFCVRDGVSKLSKLSVNGKEQIVKIATKGELLGHRSIITEKRTNLSAVALNDMEVCYISKDDLHEGLVGNTEFTNAVLRNMAEDLKNKDDALVNMSQKTIPQRLAEMLLYLQTTLGVDNAGFLAVVISRADMANYLGTATELLIRTLTKFKMKGFIKTEGKRIAIINPDGLKKLADGF